MISASAPARQLAPLRQVAANPLYRGSAIAVFVSSLGTSAAAPQIAQLLVRDLGGSLTTAGLFYLTNLVAPIAGYLIGARSDRTGGRLGLFRVCAALGFVGWAGIAFSTQVWMPFVLSAVLLGFAGAAGSQLFAAVHDELLARPDSGGDGVVAVIRMALTAGWVIGPAAGAALAVYIGLRGMLVATALCTLAQILPLGTLRTRHTRTTPPVGRTGRSQTNRSQHGAWGVRCAVGAANRRSASPGRSTVPGDDVAVARLHRPLRPRVRGGVGEVRLSADLHE